MASRRGGGSQDRGSAGHAPGFFGAYVAPMLIILPLPIIGLLFADLAMADIPDLREQARLLSLLAWSLLVSSVGAMVFAALCVAASIHSQRVQVIGFRLAWWLLRPTCVFQVVGQGVLAVALSYYVTAVFTGYVYPKLIVIVGIGVLISIGACLAAMFRTPSVDGRLHGRRLEPGQLGGLRARLERICSAMGQRLPDNIVVGIDDNFFVTEAPLTVDDRVCNGRTLFLSLPLLSRLTLDEASAVFAHEMAHLGGNDTRYSERIGNLLRRFDGLLGSLYGGMALPVFHYLLFFRALFELSLGKVSREREFRADRIAAQLVEHKALALALAKVSAFCAYRAEVEFTLFNSARGLGAGGIARRIAEGFADFVARADLERDVLQSHATHPFDRHPSFADRLAAIGLDADVLRRDDIAALPPESWRDAIVDGAGVEAALWSEYESGFQVAHEELRAYRLRPDGEAEAAIVRKQFPDRVVEGSKGAVLAIDFASISFSGWNAKIAMRDIIGIRFVEGFTGKKLEITARVDGKRGTYDLPLKIFKRPQEVAAMVGVYHGRHVEAVRYCAAHPRRAEPAEAAPEKPAPVPSGTVPVAMEPAASPAARDTAAPRVVAAAALAPVPAPRPPPPPAPVEPGVLNGRYAVSEPVDDWELGRLQRCEDRKSAEAVLCVRAGAPVGSAEELSAGIQRAAKLRLPGLVTPVRLVRARGYAERQPGTHLVEGDVVLVLPDHGTQPFLQARPKGGPGSGGLAAAMRLLRPLAEILDGCHAAGIDLTRLELEQIRCDPAKRVLLFLVAPWLGGRTDGVQPVMDPAHPRAGDPATIIAAIAALLLADPADQGLHIRVGGGHRTIPGIPFAANRLLALRLTDDGPPPPSTADAVLDELQLGHRVQLESYLDAEQIIDLRERRGLDEEEALAVVREAVRRTRPGVQLPTDQAPVRVAQRDLDAALRAADAEHGRELRGERVQRARGVLAAGGGALSLLLLLVWWFSNNGSVPPLAPLPEGAGPGLARVTFTNNRFLSEHFPRRCYTHVPSGSSLVAFYAQVVDLPTGSLEVSAVDDAGHHLGHYALDYQGPSGWLYLEFPLGERPGLASVTGQLRLDGRLLLERTVPVADSWFDGVGRLVLTLAGIWAAVAAATWYVQRRA